MTFIYSVERGLFEKNWAKTEALYREQGMSEEAIQAMREYDWDLFKAARINAMHTQDMGFQPDEDDESMESPLLGKFFDQLTNQYDTVGSHDRYWWLEELKDQRLVKGLAKLTDEDKELLTLIFAEGFTQRECAVKLHITQAAISYKIKDILGKFTEK